jgi:hypothetical protein
MALSEKGLKLGSDIIARAKELGIDLSTANAIQMMPLYPLLPQDLAKLATDGAEELEVNDVLWVFVKVLLSQLPESKPKRAIAPWAKRK